MNLDSGSAEKTGATERSDYFFALRGTLAEYAASFNLQPTDKELDTLAQNIETESLRAGESFFGTEQDAEVLSSALVHAVRIARDAGIKAAKVKMLLGLKIV